MAIQVGTPAPDFTLPASNGQTVRLSDLKGKTVILYFYPKDNTPGCTTEACDFKAQNQQFLEVDAVVLGVSPDSVSSHQKFIKKFDLPFLLLADEQQEVCELYDVWKKKSMYGKEYMGVERSTFVIDKNGVLIKEWRKVSVNGHVDEALAFVNGRK